MPKGEFSLLMSVYAGERAVCLAEALESVLVKQTLLPSEVVLVEDGPLSPDLSAVIAQYKQQFPQWVSVVLPENKGLGTALNEGLSHCSHEWVARMDSDDVALPNRFEKQWAFIEQNPQWDVVGCAVEEFLGETAPNRAEAESTAPSNRAEAACSSKPESAATASKSVVASNVPVFIRRCPAEVYPTIKFRSPLNHPTVFFRKSAVVASGGYRHCLFMEDYDLWIRLYAQGARMTSLQEVLYLFRVTPNTYKRRTGRAYAASEKQIQKSLRSHGIVSWCEYLYNRTVRITSCYLPGFLRAWIYRIWLREKKA